MHNLKVKSTRLKVDPFCEFKRNIPRLSLIMLYPFAASGTRNSGFSLFGAPPVERHASSLRVLGVHAEETADPRKESMLLTTTGGNLELEKWRRRSRQFFQKTTSNKR